MRSPPQSAVKHWKRPTLLGSPSAELSRPAIAGAGAPSALPRYLISAREVWSATGTVCATIPNRRLNLPYVAVWARPRARRTNRVHVSCDPAHRLSELDGPCRASTSPARAKRQRRSAAGAQAVAVFQALGRLNADVEFGVAGLQLLPCRRRLNSHSRASVENAPPAVG